MLTKTAAKINPNKTRQTTTSKGSANDAAAMIRGKEPQMRYADKP
jgi:hypothetical protein